MRDESNILADQTVKQLSQVTDDAVQIQHFRLQHLLAAEGQELPGQVSSAVGGLLDLHRLAVERISGFELFQHDFAIAEDDTKQVVEVVSYAASEPPHGLHLLRVTQLSLQLAPF